MVTRKKDYLRQPAATISVAMSTRPLNKKNLQQDLYAECKENYSEMIMTKEAANRILLCKVLHFPV